jgi:hypothetical protein
VTLDFTPGETPLNLQAGDGGSISINVWEDAAHTIPVDVSEWEFLAQARTKDTSEVIVIEFACAPGALPNQVVMSWTGEDSSAPITQPDGTRAARWQGVGDLQGHAVGAEPTTLVRFTPLIVWGDVSR